MAKSLTRRIASTALVLGAGALLGGMVPMVGKSVVTSQAQGSSTVAAAAEPDLCGRAVYPYLPAECLHRADGAPVQDVRWVTVESRVGQNESVLTTIPVLVD
ncbi:MAG TPA: hypothetical protein VMP03_08225 [Methylomirabilota bacterium]|nr:hypothetical protein [Methylomirabilota bacterium]